MVDLQKIISDVKSIINPVAIPEANKNDPLGYCLSEISKLVKELADNHSKQADTVAKINTMLGTLHQEVTKIKGAVPAETKPAAAPASTPDTSADKAAK